MNIHFILVEPAEPGHIGASARAINTMGFSSLILVNPPSFPHPMATQLAHGSTEILEKVEICSSLEDAIDKMDFIIGTTARHRKFQLEYHNGAEIPQILHQKGDTISEVAIVFGRESSGLTNQELLLCDMITSIPAAKTYPSLNLSQAVMIYAYILSQNPKLQVQDRRMESNCPKESEYKALFNASSTILDHIGIPTQSKLHQKILKRFAHLNQHDLYLLHFIKNKLIPLILFKKCMKNRPR